MRKIVGLVTLAIALGVLSAGGLDSADAQDKDKTKKVTGKTTTKAKTKDTAAGSGTIEVYQAKDGYRFRIKDAEGKTIAMPPRGHEDKAAVLKDLEEIKAILDKVKPTEVKN